jgi:hypothetical protein
MIAISVLAIIAFIIIVVTESKYDDKNTNNKNKK